METLQHGEPKVGRCALHPERPALGLCERCGSFYCEACFKQLASKRLCSSCLALPGVDYIAETRSRFWGKRDGFVWYLGLLGSLGSLSMFVMERSAFASPLAALNLLEFPLLVSYFMLVRWSRLAVFAIVPLSLISAIGSGLPAGLARAASGAAFSLVLCLGAWFSARNKLAFKIEVSDDDLHRIYDQYVSNPNARRALAYGILSLLVPLLGLVSLALGIQALRKVQRTAWPPVGGRRVALAGIVLSSVGLVGWTGFAIAMLMST